MKAIKEIKRRRAKEILEIQEEIISGKKRPDKGGTYWPELPIYIRTLKMLIIGKSGPISKLYGEKSFVVNGAHIQSLSLVKMLPYMANQPLLQLSLTILSPCHHPHVSLGFQYWLYVCY
jgi:hypothetical protein